jgi:hypothetical protein
MVWHKPGRNRISADQRGLIVIESSILPAEGITDRGLFEGKQRGRVGHRSNSTQDLTDLQRFWSIKSLHSGISTRARTLAE